MKDSLLTVIFKNSKRQDHTGNTDKRQKMLSFISFLIVFGSLAISMIIISYGITKKLLSIHQEYMFINILLFMDFGILFVKSVFESLNVLYFSKDLKLLLRLPLKPSNIVNSKMLKMIESEYQMEIIMLAIPMVVFGIITKVKILFYLYSIILLLVLPIIPIALASIILAIIMRFTNIIKNKNKVMYIAIIIGFILIDLILGIGNQNVDISIDTFKEQVLEVNGLANSMANSFILIKPIMNTLINYETTSGLLSMLSYSLASIGIYIVSIIIISPIYLKGAIGTTVNGEKAKAIHNSKLTIEDFEVRSARKSYIKKEFKTMNRSPIFFLQCIWLPIVYPIAVFIVVFFFGFLAKLIGLDLAERFHQQINTGIGQAIFIAIAQVFFMMNFASIIAVSKDGFGAILTKVLPISFENQLKYKTWIGRTLNYLSGFLVLFIYFALTKSLIQTIIVTIILISQNSLGEKIKILIDLKNPQITWESEYTMMKQNTNVMYVLFYSLVFVGIFFLLGKIINNAIFYINTIMWMSIIINLIVNDHIRKKQRNIFEKVF